MKKKVCITYKFIHELELVGITYGLEFMIIMYRLELRIIYGP